MREIHIYEDEECFALMAWNSLRQGEWAARSKTDSVQNARNQKSVLLPSTTSMSAWSVLPARATTQTTRSTPTRTVLKNVSISKSHHRFLSEPALICIRSLPPRSLRQRMCRPQALGCSEIEPETVLIRDPEFATGFGT
jgi:hypothetical protein